MDGRRRAVNSGGVSGLGVRQHLERGTAATNVCFMFYRVVLTSSTLPVTNFWDSESSTPGAVLIWVVSTPYSTNWALDISSVVRLVEPMRCLALSKEGGADLAGCFQTRGNVSKRVAFMRI